MFHFRYGKINHAQIVCETFGYFSLLNNFHLRRCLWILKTYFSAKLDENQLKWKCLAINQ